MLGVSQEMSLAPTWRMAEEAIRLADSATQWWWPDCGARRRRSGRNSLAPSTVPTPSAEMAIGAIREEGSRQISATGFREVATSISVDRLGRSLLGV
jgi:hypothetical protein